MSDGVDVVKALRDVRVLVAPLTRRRDVTLAFDGCDALPHASEDEQKLRRLLYKLFTVAIRNTPVNGTVRVAGEVLGGGGSSPATRTVPFTGVFRIATEPCGSRARCSAGAARRAGARCSS